MHNQNFTPYQKQVPYSKEGLVELRENSSSENGRQKRPLFQTGLFLLAAVAFVSVLISAWENTGVTPTAFLVVPTSSGRKEAILVRSRLDPTLSCTVQECADMMYSGSADEAIDRPPHLRAASSMQWISKSRLAIMQDDSNFIGLVDIDMASNNRPLQVRNAYSVALPARKGMRQFQKSRGNKRFKFDLESSIYLSKQLSPLRDEGFLLGFGSGSADYRNVIILVKDSILLSSSDVSSNFQAVNVTYWNDYCGDDSVQTSPAALVAFHAPGLYQMLRERTDFSGSELNIEGASFIPQSTDSRDPAKIRFFQRGNGAVDSLTGLNAKSSTGEILAEELFQYMDYLLMTDGQDPLFYPDIANGAASVPRLLDVREYFLGMAGDVKLTFTGSAPASISSNSVFEESDFIYIAGAEASPDATRDGAVVGTAMGLIHSFDYKDESTASIDAGSFNYLTYPNGTKFLHKTEGVTIPPGSGKVVQNNQIRGTALTVLDMDNANIPSQLCLVNIERRSPDSF